MYFCVMLCGKHDCEVQMSQFEDKPYYTPEETAMYLGVEPNTIRELARKGKIPGARKIGRVWRIPRSYLIPEPPPEKTGKNQ